MRTRHTAAALLACLLVLALSGVAQAHPELLRTEPPANAQLAEPPPRVAVFFSEPLEPAVSALELYDAQGRRVDAGGGGVAPDDPFTLVLATPSLGPGLYTAVWQTVGSDGHPVRGNFAFTVLGETGAPAPTAGTPAATPAPAAAPLPAAASDSLPGWLPALLRAAMLLGALVAGGGWVAQALVLRPALLPAAPALRHAERGWRRVAVLGALLLAAATLAFALAHTLAVAGGVSWASLRAVVFSTRLGQALVARLALAALLAALLVTPGAWRRWHVAAAGALAAALLLTFAASGHAAARPAPLLPVLADWLHLAATSVWVGGLALLALAVPPALRELPPAGRAPLLARVIARFSNLALTSVALLTLTGSYAALQQIRALSELWATPYGLALLAKLLLFGGMLLIGAYHTLVLRPSFERRAEAAAGAVLASRPERRFVRAVRAEVVLAAGVLLAAGFLTSTAPGPAAPAAADHTAQRSPQVIVVTPAAPLPTRTPVPAVPFAGAQRAGDVEVGLSVEPASVGPNTLLVTVRDAAGAPLDVQKVVLTIDMIEMDMGTTSLDAAPDGAGRYVARESWLSMVGDWHVRVSVRRIDGDDVDAEFTVPVGG